jgi:hypothetical protein
MASKEYYRMLNRFKANVRKMSHDEMADLFGYMLMSTAQTEMILTILEKKGLISKKDLETAQPQWERKVEKKFKELEKRKPWKI